MTESSDYPSVVERYYQRYSWVSKNQFKRLSGPVRILKHSNKILISCLHPDHPIRDQEIESVSYKVSEKVDHSKNKVSGKRKRGGQFLQETSPILAVKVKGQDDPILIQTGVKGKLIEVNPAILANPKLLVDESEGRGFIAILLPKFDSESITEKEHKLDFDRTEASLLSDFDAATCQ